MKVVGFVLAVAFLAFGIWLRSVECVALWPWWCE